MNNKMKNNEMIEIDFRRMMDAIVHRSWIIILVSILCGAVTFVGTLFLVTPQYESSAMFYVNNSSFSVGDASVSITSGDITASKSLVNTYIVILNTKETLDDVIDYAGVEASYKEVKDMIDAESVDDTEVFRVVVTNPDPQDAEKIASAIAYILPKRISSIVEGTSAKVVDAAVLPSTPSSPSYIANTAIGFMIGLVLSVGVVVLRELFDISIRAEEDIGLVSSHPVLASIPDMSSPSKGGYYYGYGHSRRPPSAQPNKTTLVGSGISFAASEAYKLLRTKLQYSFADENACRVIGVSSAMTGEGKSLTAVNLAHTLSQLDKRVILIDCDMRRPSLSAKLPIAKKPGLSGYLSGQNQLDSIFQFCGIPGDEEAFQVIASGQNPPNPVELLISARMGRLLEQLRESFDYVILDLPPVGEVSDALAVAKETDGILLVVRQNYCNRIALSAAVRQFEFLETRLLGIAYNCTTEDGGYGKGYYKKYYKKYYRKYEGSYMTAGKTVKNTEKGEG